MDKHKMKESDYLFLTDKVDDLKKLMKEGKTIYQAFEILKKEEKNIEPV